MGLDYVMKHPQLTRFAHTPAAPSACSPRSPLSRVLLPRLLLTSRVEAVGASGLVRDARAWRRSKRSGTRLCRVVGEAWIVGDVGKCVR